MVGFGTSSVVDGRPLSSLNAQGSRTNCMVIDKLYECSTAHGYSKEAVFPMGYTAMERREDRSVSINLCTGARSIWGRTGNVMTYGPSGREELQFNSQKTETRVSAQLTMCWDWYKVSNFQNMRARCRSESAAIKYHKLTKVWSQ